MLRIVFRYPKIKKIRYKIVTVWICLPIIIISLWISKHFVYTLSTQNLKRTEQIDWGFVSKSATPQTIKSILEWNNISKNNDLCKSDSIYFFKHSFCYLFQWWKAKWNESLEEINKNLSTKPKLLNEILSRPSLDLSFISNAIIYYYEDN